MIQCSFIGNCDIDFIYQAYLESKIMEAEILQSKTLLSSNIYVGGLLCLTIKRNHAHITKKYCTKSQIVSIRESEPSKLHAKSNLVRQYTYLAGHRETALRAAAEEPRQLPSLQAHGPLATSKLLQRWQAVLAKKIVAKICRVPSLSSKHSGDLSNPLLCNFNFPSHTIHILINPLQHLILQLQLAVDRKSHLLLPPHDLGQFLDI